MSDAAALKLTDVEIDNFKTGAFALNNDGVYVQDCDVKNSQSGIYVNSGTASVCSSDFTNNEFSWVIYGGGTGYYHDNSFGTCVKGTSVQSCGRQYFRNNSYSGYHTGMSAWSSVLQLRNEQRPDGNFEFGRNHFNGTTNTNTTPGFATADVSLQFGGVLLVDCGYNKFSAYSNYHVAHDNDGVANVLNVNYNEWSPGANYTPRLAYMTYTGDTRNTSQAVDPSCPNVYNNDGCGNSPMCPLTGVGAFLDLDRTDTTLLAARVSIRADVQDTTLSWLCRKDKAWEYYEVVRLIDSGAFRTTLKSDMKAIYDKTTLDTNFRSTALLIKAMTHMRMEEYDSAKYVWNTITTNFPTKADSVVGHWMSMHIDMITDTLNRKDTLTRAYNDRIVMDLRNRKTLPAISLYKGGTEQSEALQAVSDDVSPGSPARPNPSANGMVALDFISTTNVHCFIDVVDVRGIVLHSFEQYLKNGHNDIVVETANLTPGTYVAKVRCSEFTHSVPFVVTK